MTRSRLRQHLDALVGDFADAVVRISLEALRDGLGRAVRSAEPTSAGSLPPPRRGDRLARSPAGRGERGTANARGKQGHGRHRENGAVDERLVRPSEVTPPPAVSPPLRGPERSGDGGVRDRLIALVEAHPRGATGVSASDLAFRSGLPEARVVETLAAAVVAGRIRRRGTLYLRALKIKRRAPSSSPRTVDIEPASPDAITDPTALLAAMEPPPAPAPVAAPPPLAPVVAAAPAPALRPGEKVVRTVGGGAVVVRRRSGG